MNINRKYIIIFGTLILLLIIITGGIIYYQEKKGQDQNSDITDISKYVSNFSFPYPLDMNEFLAFIHFCDATRIASADESENKEIKEIYCSIGNEGKKPVVVVNGTIRSVDIENHSSSSLDLVYLPLFSSLASKDVLSASSYIGISVDLKDALREYDPTLLEEVVLYFCSVSEPLWLDSFSFESSYALPDSTILDFEEGDICCKSFKLDEYSIETFSGFVPNAESLSIKEYLVNKEVVNNIMEESSSQSFSDIKSILDEYPVIWQMEKPINL